MIVFFVDCSVRINDHLEEICLCISPLLWLYVYANASTSDATCFPCLVSPVGDYFYYCLNYNRSPQDFPPPSLSKLTQTRGSILFVVVRSLFLFYLYIHSFITHLCSQYSKLTHHHSPLVDLLLVKVIKVIIHGVPVRWER